MNRIAFFGSTISEEYYPAIQNIIQAFAKAGFSISLYAEFAQKLHDKGFDTYTVDRYNNKDIKTFDLVISLGGDGTFLKCTHLCYTFNIPILGINLGKLGFLAEIMPRQIDELIQDLRNNHYSICNRTLLDFSVENNNSNIHGIGLNEVTLQKSNNLKLLKLNITINNHFLCSFWADGVIVSTPTGSTGYSLSLGGPIITPDSKTLLVTPIAPHTLSIRPIIIPDSSVIRIEAQGEYTQFLISNDFHSTLISHAPQVCIKKSNYEIQTLHLHRISFFDILRNKLQLGIDIRK